MYIVSGYHNIDFLVTFIVVCADQLAKEKTGTLCGGFLRKLMCRLVKKCWCVSSVNRHSCGEELNLQLSENEIHDYTAIPFHGFT